MRKTSWVMIFLIFHMFLNFSVFAENEEEQLPRMSARITTISGSEDEANLKKLFDARNSTFWSVQGSKATLTISYDRPIVLSEYAIRTGQNITTKSLMSWEVFGSNNQQTWTSLDKIKDASFLYDSQINYYGINTGNEGKGKAYSHIKFEFTVSTSETIKIAQLRLTDAADPNLPKIPLAFYESLKRDDDISKYVPDLLFQLRTAMKEIIDTFYDQDYPKLSKIFFFTGDFQLNSIYETGFDPKQSIIVLSTSRLAKLEKEKKVSKESILSGFFNQTANAYLRIHPSQAYLKNEIAALREAASEKYGNRNTHAQKPNGKWNDSPTTLGNFWYWIQEAKDERFLKKLLRTFQQGEIPWTEEMVERIIGEKMGTLWQEYLASFDKN